MNAADLIIRGTYSVLSLYMLLILLRWIGPRLELDLHRGRLRWICSLTDPLIRFFRRVLPSLGPIDFGPLAALLSVWLVRSVIVSMMMQGRFPAGTR
jgi:YggT family protein